MPQGRGSQPRSGLLAALVLFALLTVGMTWPLVLHLEDRIPSDPYDPLTTVWIFDRNVRAAGGNLEDFGQANIFFPHSRTAYYGDILPALTLLAWPVGRLGGSYVLAYNILFLLSFVLCAWGMYALALRLSRSRPAAILAGLIFAFSAYRFGHLAHLELLYFAWIPFCLLFFHRFFDSLSLKDLAAAALFYVLQVLSCAYYGEHTTLFLALFVLFFLFRDRRYRRPKLWLKLGLVLAPTAAFLAWYFLPYLSLHRSMLFSRPLWEVEAFSAQVQHYLSVPQRSNLWGRLLGGWGGPETQLFPGLVALGLTLMWWLTRTRSAAEPQAGRVKGATFFKTWGIINWAWFLFLLAVGLSGGFSFKLAGIAVSAHRTEKPFYALLLSVAVRIVLDKASRLRWRARFRSRRPEEWLYLAFLVLAWLLSLGPVVRIFGRGLFPGLYGLLYKYVPGFQSLRVPARFSLLASLALAVFSALALARLEQKMRARAARFALAAGLSVLVLAEAAVLPLPLAPVKTRAEVPPVYAAVRALPAGAALVELPMPASDAEEYLEALPMYYSVFHGKRIVNGYSGYSPPGYRIVRQAMEGFPSEDSFVLLRDLGVTHVLIHAEGYRAEAGRRAAAAVADYEGEAEVIFRDGKDILLEVHSPARPPELPRNLSPRGRPSAWRASANRNSPSAGLAFDGLSATGWTTGYPQSPGDHFALDLGEVLEVERMEFDLGFFPYDHPRGFVLEGSLDGKEWRKLAERPDFWPRVTGATVEDFSVFKVETHFVRTKLRFVRIVLTRSDPHHWSIAEVRALG